MLQRKQGGGTSHRCENRGSTTQQTGRRLLTVQQGTRQSTQRLPFSNQVYIKRSIPPPMETMDFRVSSFLGQPAWQSILIPQRKKTDLQNHVCIVKRMLLLMLRELSHANRGTVHTITPPRGAPPYNSLPPLHSKSLTQTPGQALPTKTGLGAGQGSIYVLPTAHHDTSVTPSRLSDMQVGRTK